LVLAHMTDTNIVAELWTIAATYVTDGRIVCDLVRMGLGARSLTAVPVAGYGGGPDRALIMPPTPGVRPANGSPGSQFDPAVNAGAQAVVVYMQADPWTAPRPIIIGTMGHTSAGLSETPSESRDTDADADTTIDARTAAIKNAGGAVIVDPRGGVLLVPVAGSSVGAQLSGPAVARFSRNGAAADYATLAYPMVTAYNALLAEVAELRAQIFALQGAVNALALPAPPPFPVPISPLEPVPNLAVTDIGSDVLRVSADKVQPT
jgi:hypothetical protein